MILEHIPVLKWLLFVTCVLLESSRFTVPLFAWNVLVDRTHRVNPQLIATDAWLAHIQIVLGQLHVLSAMLEIVQILLKTISQFLV